MGCGCGKKIGNQDYFMNRNGQSIANPEDWGPILWKILHCLAEKIGNTGNPIIDTDQANYVEFILQDLQYILPCKECQEHASQYVAQNHIPVLKGLYKDDLKNAVRTWLFDFHNSVRNRKNQQITVLSLDECKTLYENTYIPQCEFTVFTQSVAYAVRSGWVKIVYWRKWYSFLERLRVLSANFIVK